MEIRRVKLEELIPYENNPRINDKAVEAVAESIYQCGYCSPIVVDEDMVILAGHTRLKALQMLEWNEVEVCIKRGLSEDQKRKYRILDNKTNEFATWDAAALLEELEGLDFGDFDFGFDVSAVSGESKNGEVVEDEIPVEVKEICKDGDIWQLGDHRLMCGDSTSAEDVNVLMNGDVADMVFTDPPYGMKKEKDGVENDNLNSDDLLEFNKKWIPLSFDHLKDTGSWYCWGIDEPLMDIYSAILKPMKRENKIVIRNFITWAKHAARGVNSLLMLSYPRETEKCWFVVKGIDWNNTNTEFFKPKYERVLAYMQEEAEAAGIKPKDIKEVCGVRMYGHWFSKSQFTVIPRVHYEKLREHYPGHFMVEYEDLQKMVTQAKDPQEEHKPYFYNITDNNVGDIGMTDVWRFNVITKDEIAEAGGHATPKPIALCARAINTSSREGENVLDLFGGSGSTLITCEQLGRRAFLMECEPKWCDTIIARWERYTGQKAVLING